MRYLAAYKARHIPRIDRNASGPRAIESALAQLSLWNAVQIQLAQTAGLSVECRIIAGRRERRTAQGDAAGQSSLYLLVGENAASSEATSVSRSIGAIERLLPMEYGWARVAPRASLRPEFEAESGWSIARVVRRVEFVTLPRVAPGLLNFGSSLDVPGLDDRVGSEGQPASTGKAPPAEPTSDRSRGAAWMHVRTLPNIQSTNVVRDLRGPKPLCLPLLGTLSQYVRTTRRLFQELEHSSPVVVSIAIHPIDSGALRRDRVIATAWKRFLEPFAAAIANAGFAEYGTLRGAYDRYWLPDKYLANLSIRVAARDDAQAVGVAQHICSRLGGMRGFEVIPPSRQGGSPIELLGDPAIDIPSPGWSGEHWENAKQFWRERLAEADVADPFMPGYIDFLSRFPHLYTVEETEQVLTLPVADDEGLAGMETQMVPPFSAPSLRYDPVVGPSGSPAEPESDRVRIGMAKSMPVMSELEGWREPEVYQWHTIKRDDLTKHALIVGSTGSGKTMATLFFARECLRLSVPFLVIEPVKTEYYDRLQGAVTRAGTTLQRLRFEGENGFRADGFFAFDPMRLQSGVTVARHASYLKSCFEAAFPMEPWLALVLEAGILAYYTSAKFEGGCGLSMFTEGGASVHEDRGAEGIFPSLKTFESFFCGSDNSFLNRAFPSSTDEAESQMAREHKQMFKRRFQNLLGGVFGQACEWADDCFRADPKLLYEPFTASLNENTVVELDGIPDPEQKSLVMAFLMTFLFERRQADDLYARRNGQSGIGGLKHVLILEEAHRLLANTGGGRGHDTVGQDSKSKAVSLFTDMLAEIRAFGQGLVIVEQIPTKIVPEAVKNTNLKIMLRLTSKEDRDYLGEAMNFTDVQKRFVTSLRAERGKEIQFVAFEEGVDQPVLLSLPLPPLGEKVSGWLFDEFFPVTRSES